jgi:AcrR family transcriptional regulator
MPKVLPEYLELRRQQILDAAAACFARRGFHQSTMQDICQEADLSPGAVYRYFPSKEAIIEAMCQRGQAQNAEALQQGLAAGSTLAVFDELIRVFFLELDNLRNFETCALNVELISEASRNTHIQEWLTHTNHDVRTPLADLVREAQSRGEIDRTLDPESIARVMQAMYQGFVTQRLVEPNIDVEAYARVLRSLFAGTFWTGPEQQAPLPDMSAALQH